MKVGGIRSFSIPALGDEKSCMDSHLWLKHVQFGVAYVMLGKINVAITQRYTDINLWYYN